jgi:hypothetical protein
LLLPYFSRAWLSSTIQGLHLILGCNQDIFLVAQGQYCFSTPIWPDCLIHQCPNPNSIMKLCKVHILSRYPKIMLSNFVFLGKWASIGIFITWYLPLDNKNLQRDHQNWKQYLEWHHHEC